jgi:hypothetical protein
MTSTLFVCSQKLSRPKKRGPLGPRWKRIVFIFVLTQLSRNTYQMKRIASWMMRGVTVAAGAPKPLKLSPAL